MVLCTDYSIGDYIMHRELIPMKIFGIGTLVTVKRVVIDYFTVDAADNRYTIK